jgi:hypothetical protein
MKLVKSREIMVEALEGCVGKAATMDFMAFLKVQKVLPDLKAILVGKSQYVPPANRIDLTCALVSALADRADPEQHFDNLIKYSFNLGPEFAVLLITMLANRDRGQLRRCPSYQKWAEIYQYVILARKNGE